MYRGSVFGSDTPLRLQKNHTYIQSNTLSQNMPQRPSATDKSIHCPGCSAYFSNTGFSLHLTQTQNPKCIPYRNELYGYHQDLDEEMPGISSSPTPDDHRDPSPDMPMFAGDFFGEDYDERDFPGWEDGDELDEHAQRELDRHANPIDDDAGPEWEPPVIPHPGHVPHEPDNANGPVDGPEPSTPRQNHQTHARRQPAQRVPYGRKAGIPVTETITQNENERYKDTLADGDNIWAPFNSKLDWELARWAKLRGPGANALTELLKIKGFRERLDLSYKTANELNKIIDSNLPGRPHFQRKQIVVDAAGEAFDVYYRDITECLKSLWSNPEFVPYLVFAPERHYVDEDMTIRQFDEMHTGRWWWAIQNELEREHEGTTIIPIIISTDKTQLTLFRGKIAYPIYLTIGNIPKDIRMKPSKHAQILLGYLPTTKLSSITNLESRRRALGNLFHAAMGHILAPLKTLGITGIEMTSGDGVTRRCHPIFAAFVGDYPEQLLVTCLKKGECPTCPIPPDELGTGEVHPVRSLDAIIEAFSIMEGDPVEFTKACVDAGIKPIYRPFWHDLPYVNIFQSITPDILHQLYQGLIKHLVSWLKRTFGAAEIDARCRRMPPCHGTRLFTKGITTLSQVSGQEHRDMCRILIGLVIDLRLPNSQSPARLVRAVRGMLDFLYLAQLKVHTMDSLDDMELALEQFHENKNIFVDIGIRENFTIPKLHNVGHYRWLVELFGTTDNYSTQTTERLHIDYAKDAYEATNHKEELIQMCLWLERKEKMFRHDAYIKWRLGLRDTPFSHYGTDIQYEIGRRCCW
ncbi:hypothetical protein QCA50_020455 [Cerrena zonata]|uniref:C2H2-type domain-containing protein n=1 Tax=Cerrena zonata TaxID=2478898 RepID=A0AAW0FD58_9APHY